MKLKNRLISALLCLCLILPLGACSDTQDAYIYFELSEQPTTLDPQTASSNQELLIIRNIFEGLLRKDSNGKIACAAAKEYSQNGLTYTFKIRDDAVWSDGASLTAYDFEFALKRAVAPETLSPFASRLFSVKNAESIYKGKAAADTLGVKAVDSKTLEIVLSKADKSFTEVLTTSVAMPCREDFFTSCAGKYGLTSDNILSNGSYKITRWRKDPFGIRLYRNDNYNGNFVAQNAAAFITCGSSEEIHEKLMSGSIDMAFTDCTLTDELKKAGLQTEEFQNICWVMTLGSNFTRNMRTALSGLVGAEVFSGSLPEGYTAANSVYPSCISENAEGLNVSVYDPENAKRLYLNEIALLDGKKFPTDITLYYYDDGSIKNAVTDIVGHWQSNFSAFVNIEAVSDSSLLLPQLTEQTYAMTLFPVSADSPFVEEYLEKFGIERNGDTLSSLQEKITESKNIIPVIFQNTVIAYGSQLSGVNVSLGNGFADFAFIIKSE